MAVNLIHEMETLIKFSQIQYLYTFAYVEFFYEALTEKKSWCENKNDECVQKYKVVCECTVFGLILGQYRAVIKFCQLTISWQCANIGIYRKGK